MQRRRQSARLRGGAAPDPGELPTRGDRDRRVAIAKAAARDGQGRKFSPKRRTSMPSHNLWQFFGRPKVPFYEGSTPAPELSSFARLLTVEGSGLWRPTSACPNIFKAVPPEIQRKLGWPEEDLTSVFEQRYGPLLDYLGSRTARFWNQRGDGGPGRNAIIRPPGGVPNLNSEGCLPLNLQATRRACITLDSTSLREKATKNIVWVGATKLGRRYFNVRIGMGRQDRNKAIYERAHRIALWCAFGPPPLDKDGRWVKNRMALHMCGNPRCINPEHLVWGDRVVNAITDSARAHQAYQVLLKMQGRLPSL